MHLVVGGRAVEAQRFDRRVFSKTQKVSGLYRRWAGSSRLASRHLGGRIAYGAQLDHIKYKSRHRISVGRLSEVPVRDGDYILSKDIVRKEKEIWRYLHLRHPKLEYLSARMYVKKSGRYSKRARLKTLAFLE